MCSSVESRQNYEEFRSKYSSHRSRVPGNLYRLLFPLLIITDLQPCRKSTKPQKNFGQNIPARDRGFPLICTGFSFPGFITTDLQPCRKSTKPQKNLGQNIPARDRGVSVICTGFSSSFLLPLICSPVENRLNYKRISVKIFQPEIAGSR